MGRSALCTLAFIIFLVPFLTVPAQESDFAIKRDFEDRAAVLRTQIDAAVSTAQLDSLKNAIDGFEMDFSPHSDFLDKALYPETFTSRMKEMRERHERTLLRVRTIESQGTRMAEMEGAIQTLTYRLDTLSAERDRLFAELKVNKTNATALRETVRRLESMLQARDRLMFALVDSIFMPYGQDLATLDDVQREALSTKLTDNNLVNRIYSIAADNVRFLGATELQGKDYAALLDNYRQFAGRWKGLSDKIQAVGVAGQMPGAARTSSSKRAESVTPSSRSSAAAQVQQVDSLLGEWNARLQKSFWSAVEREFTSRQIQIMPFSDGPGFSAAIRTYVQSLQTSGDDPSVFVEEIWKAKIDKEWRDALTRDGMLGKEEYASLDKLVSELAKTKFDLKFVLYAGIIGLGALVLWWLLARKPKA
jgi:hypothetical protein